MELRYGVRQRLVERETHDGDAVGAQQVGAVAAQMAKAPDQRGRRVGPRFSQGLKQRATPTAISREARLTAFALVTSPG